MQIIAVLRHQAGKNPELDNMFVGMTVGKKAFSFMASMCVK